MTTVPQKLALLAVAGLMVLAAACTDSTAPKRDCYWVSGPNGSTWYCDPG